MRGHGLSVKARGASDKEPHGVAAEEHGRTVREEAVQPGRGHCGGGGRLIRF